jgi:hypothetical protein
MMTHSLADPVRLLRFGLDASVPPARNDEYRELVTACLADPTLREQLEQAAAALELDVLHVDATVGVVVAPRTSSAFAPTWSWVREQAKIKPTAENRMIVGMLIVGVAALCYPTAAALSDPGLRRFTASDVDTLLRRHAKMLADGDTVLEDGLETAWQAYSARKAVQMTKGGKMLATDCTVRLSEQVCDLLARQRLLLRTEDAGAVVYRSTDRFRHLVARHAATLAYRTLIDSDASAVAESLTTAEA